MSPLGLLLIMLVTAVVSVVGILLVGRARKLAGGLRSEDLASRDGTRRFLAENWATVEKTARESGMSEEEIARMRANVLGL